MQRGEIDEAMALLGLPPFLPSAGVGHMREHLWREVCKARVRGLVPTPPAVPKHAVVSRRPGPLPRAVKNNNSLLRSMFVAALPGISFQDAVLIVQAHMAGVGVFGRNPEKMVVQCFNILAGLGWGIEQTANGLIRIYR
jgi:hypothetical protein